MLGLYDEQGWVYRQVRTLGSYAHTSTPAYILSGLFLVSTPLGFASPAQAAAEAALRTRREQQLAAAAKAVRRADGKPTSGFVARLVASNTLPQAPASPMRAMPPFWQLAFLSAAFATGGYVIDQNDDLNGSGIVTAWSLFYLCFRTAPTLRQLPRSPWALALSTAVLSLGLGVHGSHYFDKTSWRGAVPLFASPGVAKQQPVYASNRTPRAIPPAGTAPTPARNNDTARAAAFLRRQAT